MEKEKILEIKNLKVSFHTYAGEVHAVRGIDFHLYKGETLAIVGESGCGKSVTSKAIMRLLPNTNSEIKSDSQILYNGKDITKLKEKDLKNLRGSEISMIFQDPMSFLNPTMKVGKQIAENLIVHKKLGKEAAMKEAIKMLELVKLPNADKRANQYPHEFSGGMRQRAMIAMALSCVPKILIADEPTTALDVTIQAQVMDVIEDLQHKLGTTVILITHDLGIVARSADRIHVMYAGMIVERGTSEEIFYNPQHPYTWALLKSVPRLNTENKDVLYSLGGTPPDLINPPKGCAFSARCKYCMPICKNAIPKATALSDTQEVRCWLKHPMAPEVDLSEKVAIGGEV